MADFESLIFITCNEYFEKSSGAVLWFDRNSETFWVSGVSEKDEKLGKFLSFQSLNSVEIFNYLDLDNLKKFFSLLHSVNRCVTQKCHKRFVKSYVYKDLQILSVLNQVNYLQFIITSRNMEFMEQLSNINYQLSYYRNYLVEHWYLCVSVRFNVVYVCKESKHWVRLATEQLKFATMVYNIYDGV